MSVVYVDSCVVSLFMLLDNRDSASVTMFFLTGIYSISGIYSSSISIHRNIQLALKFFNVILCGR